MDNIPRDPLFCIVGPIQGNENEARLVSQGYRQELSNLVFSVLPDAREFRPDLEVINIVRSIGLKRFRDGDIDSSIIALLKKRFLKATAAVGKCDIVIGYMPSSDPSMGTAMELYSACLGGSYTILITDRIDNLALRSVASRVVSDFDAVRDELVEHFKLRLSPKSSDGQ